MADAQKLNSFDSLIENDILSAREYKNGDVERNGYHTIKLFSPIYSALSSEKERLVILWVDVWLMNFWQPKALKMVWSPYISNQYEDDASKMGNNQYLW